jgi:hypothetical protein
VGAYTKQDREILIHRYGKAVNGDKATALRQGKFFVPPRLGAGKTMPTWR